MLLPPSLVLLGFFLAQSPSGVATDSRDKKAEAQPESKISASKIDQELGEKLLKVKRIYVDTFGDDPISKTLQGMVISALADCKRFIVTENKDKADAVLKGTTLEKTSQEFHASGSGTAVSEAAGSVRGDVVGRTGSVRGGFAGVSSAIDDSQSSTQTINDARLAVRLVSTDGDVIWSTTQESKGAKFKGAGADVADKIAKQLLRDTERASKPPSSEK